MYYSNFSKSHFRLFHPCVPTPSSPVVFLKSFDVFQDWLMAVKVQIKSAFKYFSWQPIITFIWLSPQAGKMEQILCSDWLQDGPTLFARDQSRRCPTRKDLVLVTLVITPSLAKKDRWRWLIGWFVARQVWFVGGKTRNIAFCCCCPFYSTNSYYTDIVISRLVKNLNNTCHILPNTSSNSSR